MIQKYKIEMEMDVSFDKVLCNKKIQKYTIEVEMDVSYDGVFNHWSTYK